MLLVVDVGNTNTVLGLYRGKTLLHHFRIQSEQRRTDDEYRVLFATLVQLAGLSPGDITESIIASVVPTLTEPLVRAVRRAFDHEIIVVGPGIKTGMPILTENPREV